MSQRPEGETAYKAKRIASKGLLYALATGFAMFAAIPFFWMVLTVFKTNEDLYNPRSIRSCTTIRQHWATSICSGIKPDSRPSC